MAKSIRLKAHTQERVAQEAMRLEQANGFEVRHAQVVDVLVNEALDAREAVAKKKVTR